MQLKTSFRRLVLGLNAEESNGGNVYCGKTYCGKK
jgi:hypothetical protein